MITCKLVGGLGNQLFQIFATIAYCMRVKHPFVFAHNIRIFGEMNRSTYWDTLLSGLKHFTNYDGLISDDTLLNQFTLFTHKHGYIDIPLFDTSNILLDGFFQSYKYFYHEYSRIYELLDIDGLKQRVLLPENTENVPTISLHFRLGDYLNLQCYHPIMPNAYYIRALQHIINTVPRVNNAIVYVFCEHADIDRVNAAIEQIRNSVPLQFKVIDEMCDWKQMLLMSKCDHHIIANSSFSWWGAIFADSTIGNNPEKIVCYPSMWFGHNLSYIDINNLFLPSWVKIDVLQNEVKCSCHM